MTAASRYAALDRAIHALEKQRWAAHQKIDSEIDAKIREINREFRKGENRAMRELVL